MSPASKQNVFVVPGFLGSKLEVDGRLKWFAPHILFGRLGDIAIAAEKVTASSHIGFIYNDLLDALATNHNAISFPADWRIAIQSEGKRLAESIEVKLDESDRAVSIIGHSQGGLIARAAVAQSDRVADAMRTRPGSRLIQLGTPNAGTHIVTHFLLGFDWHDPLFTKAALKKDDDTVREIMGQYPGLLDLLPVDPIRDLFSEAVWKEMYEMLNIKAVPPSQTDLDQSRNFRTWIDATGVDNSFTYYVAGKEDETAYGLDTTGKSLTFTATDSGDGVSDWEKGTRGVDNVWLVPERKREIIITGTRHHAFLPRYEPVLKGVLDILSTGDTTALTRLKHSSGSQTIKSSSGRFKIPGFIA